MALGSSAAAAEDRAVAFHRQVRPLLEKHCTLCHNKSEKKGDLVLDRFAGASEAALVAELSLWRLVGERLAASEMPPSERPAPSAGELRTILSWIADIERAAAGRSGDPGRVTIRRLNRAEYDNTVRDLLGVDAKPARDFPADDVGYGFDNIGDVLSLPPVLVERYLAAAELLAKRTILVPSGRRARGSPGAMVWPATHTRIIPHPPARGDWRADARRFLGALATRAYRRPAAPDEVERLVMLVGETIAGGGRFERGMQLALQAVLMSPHFLFRVELDEGGGETTPVDDHQLASRLSYFLWSSMPDDELFRLAAAGRLGEETVLAAQVRRMLDDPRSRALVDDFAPQWLQTRVLATFRPSRKHFPSFDDELRAAMITETQLFFEAVMRDDLRVGTFLDADFTFVNGRLARHYGLPAISGSAFRRVSLAGTARGGVLTQGSVLTVTSNPTRTSPVKRGRWVLEQLLGTPPPPPPPEVPELPEAKGTHGQAPSLRARLERHRVDPACAVCHQKMDPLGLGLENFDAIGAWRSEENGSKIDVSGVLPGGRAFDGPAGLRAMLREKEGQFRRALAGKLLTYALGRGTESYDLPAIDRICAQTAEGGDRFSDLVLAIVRSEPFRLRRGEAR